MGALPEGMIEAKRFLRGQLAQPVRPLALQHCLRLTDTRQPGAKLFPINNRVGFRLTALTIRLLRMSTGTVYHITIVPYAKKLLHAPVEHLPKRVKSTRRFV